MFFCLALGAAVRTTEDGRRRWIVLLAGSLAALAITHLISLLVLRRDAGADARPARPRPAGCPAPGSSAWLWVVRRRRRAVRVLARALPRPPRPAGHRHHVAARRRFLRAARIDRHRRRPLPGRVRLRRRGRLGVPARPGPPPAGPGALVWVAHAAGLPARRPRPPAPRRAERGDRAARQPGPRVRRSAGDPGGGRAARRRLPPLRAAGLRASSSGSRRWRRSPPHRGGRAPDSSRPRCRRWPPPPGSSPGSCPTAPASPPSGTTPPRSTRTGIVHPETWLAHASGRNSLNGFNLESSSTPRAAAAHERPRRPVGHPHRPPAQPLRRHPRRGDVRRLRPPARPVAPLLAGLELSRR